MNITDYSNYLIFFSGALIISLVVNLLLLKFSQNLGIRNKNDVTVRWSSTSKPSLGGISLFLGFLFWTMMKNIRNCPHFLVQRARITD
jgi:UDP-GlcNAc:undecaprenyl-phosphate GlcNAc-1-phosphate transferase